MMVYLVSLTRSFAMKSSASFETLVNASSSKSYLPMVTLAIVSMSVEPMNGDKPDKLCFNCNNLQNIYVHIKTVWRIYSDKDRRGSIWLQITLRK